jgi:hypothetical protein
MNISPFTVPLSSRTASRANLSPVARRRSSVATAARSTSSFATPAFGHTAELPTLRSSWPADLLDRLHPAVTRYHY